MTAMSDLAEPVSDVTRPRLMPRKAWKRPPSAEEADIIPLWEEKYIKARARFEKYDDRAKGNYSQNPMPITPKTYLKWLRTATRHYSEWVAQKDPRILKQMRVMKATLAGLGHIDHPPMHGEIALTVDEHGQRVKGEDRGRTANGERLDAHHTPPYGEWAKEFGLSRNATTSVAIGEDLHAELHQERDPQRPNETLFEQVNGDFKLIKQRMEQHGYQAGAVALAREKAHDLNYDLGIYRGGR
jgi:hypothetical protein